VLFLGSLVASGQATKRVPVTDPAVLESMGFSPEAKNVFRLEGPPRPLEAERISGPKYFGPNASGFSGALGQSFIGRSSAFSYDNLGGQGDIYNTNSAENFADAELAIPSGAELQFARVWFSDTNAAQNITFFLIEVCQPIFGPGGYTLTTLGSVTSSGSGGDGSFTTSIPAGTLADSNACIYKVRVRFGNGAAIGPGDSSLVVQKARVQWARTVSAAPAVATFPVDVPTNHPYFRFVEALVTTGITAGTGPGTYSPDAPVTRGEMAVFLAAALGLDHGF
jgi:hypothetical protein